MPKRLTEAAQEDRDDFVRMYGPNGRCNCHINPPCSSCTHPGNPHCQEDDKFWEEDT